MSAPVTVVVPIDKGSLSEAAAISRAVWASMSPQRRVVFDYGHYFRACLPPVGQAPGDDPVVLRDRARSGRGVVLPRGDDPRPGDAEVALALRDLRVGVLITTRWFLSAGMPGEEALLRFIAASGCSVIAWVNHYAGYPMDYTASLVAAVRDAAGDRLLTLHPPLPELASPGLLQGRTVPAKPRLGQPLQPWLIQVVREHAGLSEPGGSGEHPVTDGTCADN